MMLMMCNKSNAVKLSNKALGEQSSIALAIRALFHNIYSFQYSQSPAAFPLKDAHNPFRFCF